MSVKTLLKSKRVLGWGISTLAFVAVVVAANITTTVVLPDLINGVLGGERAIVDESEEFRYFKPDFENKDQALDNGNQVTQQICEEGMVLLKNENNALPLTKGAKISIFGKNSVNLVYGGSGSAAPTQTVPLKTIYDSLNDAGFECNQALKGFYEDNSRSGNGRSANPKMEHGDDGISVLETGETDVDNYPSDVTGSYAQYKDAALVVFSRIAGENWDLPRVSADGVPGRHYLELDKNERKLLEHICAQDFAHVIVLFNGSNNIDMAFLKIPTDPAYNEKIDGALLIGSPGATGIMALGRILNGTVNPSGHLTDTIYTHYDQDPTWQNFGDNATKDGDSSYGDAYIVDGEIKPYFSVAYEEGIYLGYRYYETRYAEMEKKAADSGKAWYDQHVLYPFGFGLSYTTFEQSISNKTAADITDALDANKDFTVDVKVKNTGSKPGKQVVQVYASAPYYDGGIEKSYKVLVGFAKTPVLQPQEETTEPLHIKITPYDFASFDEEGEGCYVLEQGEYKFFLGTDAHTDIDFFTKNLAQDAKFETDPVTGYKVEPVFYKTSKDEKEYLKQFLQENLSRSDFEGTFPVMPTEENLTVNQKFINKEDNTASDNPNEYKEMPKTNARVTVRFNEMPGLKYDDEKWEEFLNEMTFDEMLDLFNKGMYATNKIARLGVPKTLSCDGPTGLVAFMGTPEVYGTCYYCSECLVAQTYNIELAGKQGNAVGNEALFGDRRANGSKLPYTGWYSPGVNLHRSPFSGRNTEYYSEDPFISGKMAAVVIRESQAKGVYTTVKHFALNEQETHRSDNGQNYWVKEQAIRELYLKPFEIAIKEGQSKGLMSSFTRIGRRWCGGSYPLLTTVLRDEWGFEGLVICDFHTDQYMDCKQMIYAGGDLNLTGTAYWKTANANEVEDVVMLRRASHNILYALANSNIMNQTILGYKLPVWQVILFISEGVLGAGFLTWGFFAISSSLRRKEALAASLAEQTISN